MTSRAFDLATLLPNELPVVGDTVVVRNASPLDMDWAALPSGSGAFVPAASAQNQTLVSGAGPTFAWSVAAVVTQAYVDAGDAAAKAYADSAIFNATIDCGSY